MPLPPHDIDAGRPEHPFDDPTPLTVDDRDSLLLRRNPADLIHLVIYEDDTDVGLLDRDVLRNRILPDFEIRQSPEDIIIIVRKHPTELFRPDDREATGRSSVDQVDLDVVRTYPLLVPLLGPTGEISHPVVGVRRRLDISEFDRSD